MVIFIRCFILASAILGIPALAIMWDWLPGSLNEAVASIIPNRADRDFETVAETGRPLTNEQPMTTESPIKFAQWGNTPLAPADEHETYGANATVKIFEVRDPVSGQNSSMATGSVLGKHPEDAVVPSQTLVQTSSPAVTVAASEPAQYYHGQQDNAPNDLLKEELNALGVEQFNLQQWGNSGSLWRCSCQVRSGAMPGGLKTCFEAVDTDSNRAITMVLTKIRDWKANSVALGI